ncbi:MAG: phospholipase D-like domain-containing protein [Syntrophorhabdaceae bacterium]
MVPLRNILAVLFLAGMLSFTGCAAGLPNVSAILGQVPPRQTPTISGSRGPLPESRSEKLISDLEKTAGPTDVLQHHTALMESLSGHFLTTGNRATLLVDGPATYAAMFGAMENAKDHINIETYKFEDDDIGRQFSDLILQKAAQGVAVNLLYDSVGCLTTPRSFFDRLSQGGVNVVEFNPIDPTKLKSKQFYIFRDHRKLVIVDGRTAFTGGVNFSNVYSGASGPSGKIEDKTRFGWRDTHVMIEGPVVEQFQRLFFQNWKEQSGPEPEARNYFPLIEPKGKELVLVIGSSPDEPDRLTYIMYVAAILKAERSVRLTNSYFVPDRQMVNALKSASKRGVDVELVLPGISDFMWATYAAQSSYEDLLESGVRIFERHDRVLHSKTAVIDDVWSTIGSTNLDLWSFVRNDEINAIILGVDFSNQMEHLFENDKEHSVEITKEGWSRRSLFVRIREWMAKLMAHWL